MKIDLKAEPRVILTILLISILLNLHFLKRIKNNLLINVNLNIRSKFSFFLRNTVCNHFFNFNMSKVNTQIIFYVDKILDIQLVRGK